MADKIKTSDAWQRKTFELMQDYKVDEMVKILNQMVGLESDVIIVEEYSEKPGNYIVIEEIDSFQL